MLGFSWGCIITIISILVIYLIGFFVRYLVRGRVVLILNDQNGFLNILVGLITLVTVYSIWRTRGNTINWLFLLIGLFYFYFGYQSKKYYTDIKFTFQYKRIFILLLSAIILYVIYYFSSVSIKYNVLRPVIGDDYYYANLSTFLNRGFENLSFSKNFIQECSNNSYHFFEIWINSALYSVFDINALFSFSVILPVIFQVAIYFGFLSIAELYYKRSWIVYLVCFLFLFTTNISIILSHISPHSFLYPDGCSSSIILLKEAPISLFVLASLFFVMKSYRSFDESYKILHLKDYSFLCILSLSIVSTTAIPVLFSTLGMYLLLQVKGRKLKDYRLYLFLFFVLFFVFYILVICDRTIDSSNSIPYVFDYSLLRLYITLPLGILFNYCLLITILLFLIPKEVFSFIEKYGIAILCFFIFPISLNIFIRQIHGDAVQFTFIPYTSIFNILFPSLLLFAFWATKNKVFRVKFIVILLFVSNLILNISSVFLFKYRKYQPLFLEQIEYQKKIVKTIDLNRNIKVGFYINECDYSSWRKSNDSNSNGFVTFLQAYSNNCFYYSINRGIKGFSDITPYMIMYNEILKLTPKPNIDELQRHFFSKVKIDYVLVYPNVDLSDYFKMNTDLVGIDPIDSIRFYRVKPSFSSFPY